MSTKIEVVAPGPFATVQDLGRPGLASLGVGRSGAADRSSLRLGNRLAGNPEGNAAIEATLGGLVIRFSEPALIAVTGAVCEIRVGGRAAGMFAPIQVRSGEEVKLSVPSQGLRTYLAVRGGIDVTPVLHARATDTLAKLGPPALSAGMTLPIGARVAGYPVVDLAPQKAFPEELVLRVTPGPRLDWFVPGTMTTLTTTSYEVTANADRVGLRLSGPELTRCQDGELAPEACVPGALQVPPSGVPILFLVDHPVTGGYPVVAVVDDAGIDLAAQARPGRRIRFTR
ncbi:biotin-dependent carboxyltransferase family protein [Amycolatopsis sp.]|jgi:biotin-dependent carboxylase-like uncharacterized protein|uniref:5-oxoprolinase subunit C family protein n=1 Tax=Amycolatopsis sp. TaxID=37632 RepID=UPI002E03A4DD|nr:biotin-dependent carboxyltransferase family protein [Amycolatopsis sp.]